MSRRFLWTGVVVLAFALVLAVALVPNARAHCDAIDGPVATAALKALDTRNVNLVLPYVPVEAEDELTTAYERSLAVRGKGPEAKALADQYFMETSVRLHRAGEGASYMGLKPAGTDFGPAIPAAERALDSGEIEPLVHLLSEQVARGIAERFEHARSMHGAPREPATRAQVAQARERIAAELEFVGYVHNLYLASRGGAHAE